MALHTVRACRASSSTYLVSAFLAHSASFPTNVSNPQKVKCVLSMIFFSFSCGRNTFRFALM